MSTVSRRSLVRAAAVTACAGNLLALPTAAALAEGVPAVTSAHSAAPQRHLVKSLALADGVSTARVYRVAGGAYQADILGADGRTATTLTSRDGETAVGGAGDLHAALGPDGWLSSWVGDGREPGPRSGGQVLRASAPEAADTGSRTVAIGSVDAQRLSTLADGPGGGVLLLAAGGGIAAVGASGLGFAMLRRGRTDG